MVNTNLAPGSPSVMAVADVPQSSPRIKAHVVLDLWKQALCKQFQDTTPGPNHVEDGRSLPPTEANRSSGLPGTRGQACENVIMFNTILINTNLAPGSPSVMVVADVPQSSPRIKVHVVLASQCIPSIPLCGNKLCENNSRTLPSARTTFEDGRSFLRPSTRGQACENLIMFYTIFINTNFAPGSPSGMAVADVPQSLPRIKAHVVLLLRGGPRAGS